MVILMFIFIGVRFHFEEPMYSVDENSGPANLVIIKEGQIDRDIDIDFATIDDSAISAGQP